MARGRIFYIPADVVKEIDEVIKEKSLSPSQAVRDLLEIKKKKKVLKNWN